MCYVVRHCRNWCKSSYVYYRLACNNCRCAEIVRYIEGPLCVRCRC